MKLNCSKSKNFDETINERYGYDTLKKVRYMKKICPSYVGVHILAQKFHFLCQLKIRPSVRCKVTLPLMRLIITCTVPKKTNSNMILQQVDWFVTQPTSL